MKKLTAIIIVLTCLLTLAACNKESTIPKSGNPFFIAKVCKVNEITMLIEVTDKGNCSVQIGDPITISTEKIDGVLASDPTTVTNNYLRIEFDGNIMETYPLQLGEIFRIDITNKNGESIE